MKMQSAIKKPVLTAVSLVEVLVVLAIIAVSMVGATQLSVQALLRVKEDEIRDYVNSQLLQVLEVAKSPNVVAVNNQGAVAGGDFSGSYNLAIGAGGTGQLLLQSTSLSEISTCTNTDIYSVNFDSEAPTPLLCLQLIADKVSVLGGQLYHLYGVAVFSTARGTETARVEGYRKGGFTN